MEWYLWPTANPADLGDHLTTAGLVADGDSPMMAFDLTQSLPTLPPVGARIERVSDQATFAQWVKVAVDGFGFPESARAIASDLFTMLGYDEPMCQYLTWLDGEPVATTTLLLNGKTAGVFNVATLPAVRGKGIGSAITAHTLREARAAGGHVALLVASAMGEPVYRRLGFQTRGAVTSYLWRPETTE
jgi:GNAT superfamily N-acetyltransferase